MTVNTLYSMEVFVLGGIYIITRVRVEYGRIFHEQYFHEPKASVNNTSEMSGHITR